MTAIRQLVTDAFRESGLIETGGVPDGDEFEEGLRKLQSMYSGLFGNELGDPLTTLNFGKNGLSNSYATALDYSPEIAGTYVPPNVRLIFNVIGPQTIYLHPSPRDGMRLSVIDNAGNLATNNVIINGNGRQIEGANSVTLNTNSIARDWFYREDLGAWTRVTDLAAEDESPLPLEFDDMLSTLLALRLNPRYGAQMDQSTIEILERGRRIFRARYKQISEQSSEDALIRLPSNPYWYSDVDPHSSFDRGRP